MIELLVTMTMIAIISSAVFAGRGNMEKDLTLQRTAYTLTQNFREAQEMSMGSGEDVCPVGRDVCGYGISFGSTEYRFFADCENDCSSSNHRKTGQDVDLRQVFFENNIEITGTNPNNLDVVFTPPDPKAYINGVEWGSEAIITFGVDAKTRQVKINSAGRVEMLSP